MEKEYKSTARQNMASEGVLNEQVHPRFVVRKDQACIRH